MKLQHLVTPALMVLAGRWTPPCIEQADDS
jgi:hypothetical protein